MPFFTRVRVQRVALLATVLGGIYFTDHKFNARTLQRNTLTVWNGPGKSDKIDDLHERVANRILNVCRSNGGLYIKLGQSIGVQSSILPLAYQKAFKSLYDDAPAVDFNQVIKVFEEDFCCHPDDMFDNFERTAIASASVAQVHRAKLKDGTLVAVKIQKPDIRKQMDWDLLAYKALMYMYEYIFDLPLTWSSSFTVKHIRQEGKFKEGRAIEFAKDFIKLLTSRLASLLIDFENEGRNAEKARQNFEKESSLCDKAYVPTVFWDYTSKRILTAEWINGVKVTDIKGLESYGFSLKDVMKTVIDVFSFQIFQRFVHADPHPGNVFVRPHPLKGGKNYQIVLIDHGLYVEESASFRQQYCLFWKSLFLMDTDAINQICKNWGINEPEIFASATLMKPYQANIALHITSTQAVTLQDAYEMQMAVKERIKQFLSDTELIPRELIFVGRNMNIVRSLNRELGSPVNRINIMGEWAAKGLGPKWSVWNGTNRKLGFSGNLSFILGQFSFLISSRFNYWLFKGALFLISLRFYFNKTKETIIKWIKSDSKTKGFEEILDDQMKRSLEQNFGVVLDERIFEG
ncbi:13948_t:CDS:10 [Entrophospora sp. SA101]|nr:13948_t:CDS:10 [Entrophospora sp. SA101]